MLFLLDTNVVSEAWKAKPSPSVERWMFENSKDCALSVITLTELDYGLHLLPFGKRRSALERNIGFLRQDFADSIIGFDLPEASAWAAYAAEVTGQHGKKFWNARTMRDSALAATARAWSLTVITRDTSHFPFIETLNPF
jgi:predicted nucleic acid-binding protein